MVMIDGWATGDLEPFGALGAFGFVSKASNRGMSSFLIPLMRGSTTLRTMDTRPSRIDFKPSPRMSVSRPRPNPSNASSTSPARVARPIAWSWVALGFGF